jgi:multiple sugar transport system ATP-binding protein
VLVEAAPLRLKLPETHAKKVAAYVGRPVIFGVRPDDIYDRALHPPIHMDEGNSCTLDVDVTEPMGANVYAYLTAGPHSLIADLKSETQAKIGGRLEVAFDMAKTHLFDPETEVALT